MNLEGNKELVREFFTRFGANDIAGALACLTDDATWWIAGKPGALPVRGLLTKETIARVFFNMAGRLKEPLELRVVDTIAEGDRVALEVESRGELDNGRVYEQQYHFAMTFRDGKICAVREYLDTQHVFATWFHP